MASKPHEESPLLRRAVAQQLERILESPGFHSSARARDFLTFVVDETLSGRQDEIKERVIGIQVFGRPAGFETAGDSIVRVNANDVRKRLFQYYHEIGASDPVRIDLPPGTYVPEFHTLQSDPAFVDQPVLEPLAEPVRPRWKLFAIILPILFLCGIVGLHSWNATRKSPLERFWDPMVRNPNPIVLVLPYHAEHLFTGRAFERIERIRKGQTNSATDLSQDDIRLMENQHVSLQDFYAVLGIASILNRGGRSLSVRLGSEIKADELRAHSFVAIGAYSNPWMRERLSGLRFTYSHLGAAKGLQIVDALHPNDGWILKDPNYPWGRREYDYAVITRIFDSRTAGYFIGLAGLNCFGTQAAGEFVSDPRHWEELSRTAPKGWERMNLQVVIQTRVVGTTPSSPKVMAMHFWAADTPDK